MGDDERGNVDEIGPEAAAVIPPAVGSMALRWILVAILGTGAAGGKVLFDHSLSDRVSAVEAKLDLILQTMRRGPGGH
jgi:hypothetical protein